MMLPLADQDHTKFDRDNEEMTMQSGQCSVTANRTPLLAEFHTGRQTIDGILPRIVSRAEWQKARDQLLVKEKAATRARDPLAAERRRLPMVRIEKD
jgi:Bacterial protein of unknown function (DUF899)